MRKFLLLTCLWLGLGAGVPVSQGAETSPVSQQQHTLDQTSSDLPSWQDVGLKDLIANVNGSSIQVPQGNNGGGSSSAHHACVSRGKMASRFAHGVSACPALPTRLNDYYLYTLYRLRL